MKTPVNIKQKAAFEVGKKYQFAPVGIYQAKPEKSLDTDTLPPSDMYRVPMMNDEDEYCVWIGTESVKYYNVDTLPDLIKAKLGFILTANIYGSFTSATEYVVPESDEGVQDAAFADVGWQVSKHLFCIVMTYDELQGMRGTK
jgi:hypothetical protein